MSQSHLSSVFVCLQVVGEFGYEPYVIVNTDQSPRYPETLSERMRDKLPYTIEMQMAGSVSHCTG